MANAVHINYKSKSLIDEINTKLFLHLFELLADKTSNVVTGKDIDLSEIPVTVQTIIIPLLDELKVQNEALTFEQFIVTLKFLYNTLSITHKQILMDWYLSFNKLNKSELVKSDKSFSFKVNFFKLYFMLSKNEFLFLKSLASTM